MLSLEAKQQALGCKDDVCDARVGDALGAELVASASIGRLGEVTVLSLKLIDAHAVTVLGRAEEQVQSDEAYPAAAAALVGKLVRALWPNAADEVAAAGPTIKKASEPEVGDEGTHVAFRISDDNGVVNPQVMWRYAGESTFRSEPLLRGEGANLYEARLPGRPVDESLEYRVVAADSQSLEQSVWPSRLESAKIAPVEQAHAGKRGRTKTKAGLVVDLTVTARRPGGKEEVVLKGGEPLSEGAQLAFALKVNKPAYVYLAERHKSGAFEVLFPNPMIATKNPIAAGTSVRIPAEAWFALDNEDLGPETVMVLASPTPLKDLEGSFARASKGDKPDVQVGGDLLAAASDSPSCRTRGLKLENSDDCRPRTRGLIVPTSDTAAADAPSVTISARPSDPVVFVPFQFQHVPKP